jgi:hypothetical protein
MRRAGAQVAQLVEHVTENHGVGGSIPPLGTTPPFATVRNRSPTTDQTNDFKGLSPQSIVDDRNLPLAISTYVGIAVGIEFQE